MARPKGSFEIKKNTLYNWLYTLSLNRKGHFCCPTNKALAEFLNVTSMSISRYLLALKKEGKIRIETTKLLQDPRNNAIYKKRKIYIRDIDIGKLPSDYFDLKNESYKRRILYRKSLIKLSKESNNELLLSLDIDSIKDPVTIGIMTEKEFYAFISEN